MSTSQFSIDSFSLRLFSPIDCRCVKLSVKTNDIALLYKESNHEKKDTRTYTIPVLRLFPPFTCFYDKMKPI